MLSILSGVAALLLAAPALVAAPSRPGAVFAIVPGWHGQTTLPSGHYNYALPPGSTLADSVYLYDLSDRPLTLQVYPADMLQAKGGGLAPAQRDQPAHGVGGWLTLGTTSVAVQPHAKVKVGFRVSVPDDALPGDHLGAVVAALNLHAAGAGGVGYQARAALIVRVTVLGELSLRLEVPSLTSADAGPGRSFRVTATNEGNVLLTLRGNVQLRDSSGRLAGEAPLGPSGIYVVPHGSVTMHGLWRAAPLVGRMSAEAELQGDAGEGHRVLARSPKIDLWFVPTWLVAGPLALLAVLIWLLIDRRRWRAWLARRRDERRQVAAFRAELRRSSRTKR